MDIGFLSSKNNASKTSISHSSLLETDATKSKLGKFFEKSIVARRILLFIAMLGMCMLIGDGILTPAISGLQTQFTFYYAMLHI